MIDHESYLMETRGGTLVVRFRQSSLIFPDQLPAIEVASDPKEVQFRSVALDFNGVGHISSSVWGHIIILNRTLRESDRQLRLCNLTDNLQEALDAMKLDQLLSVCATLEDALNDLGSE